MKADALMKSARAALAMAKAPRRGSLCLLVAGEDEPVEEARARYDRKHGTEGLIFEEELVVRIARFAGKPAPPFVPDGFDCAPSSRTPPLRWPAPRNPARAPPPPPQPRRRRATRAARPCSIPTTGAHPVAAAIPRLRAP